MKLLGGYNSKKLGQRIIVEIKLEDAKKEFLRNLSKVKSVFGKKDNTDKNPHIS